ncbi:hypothetical protein DFJ75_1701 [Williamsia muralis]|uniref:Uncharacterized protein n=1 Tax=Williamsia marianensis TaxID=85044 RepID=A0A495K0Z4_WILMA|nr:hypothetical protein [Williamsia muralis]RKR94896.1 hypothetical protein DFJ75_1701 [Williamsia muralis]
MVRTRTLRDVELIKVGSWDISTGSWAVTAGDLESAVAAHHAGVLRKPPLKLGHIDDRFDGQPSFGHIDDVRVAEDGATLVGDLVVPEWLAASIPVHWPDRSVEALKNFEAADGTMWPLVLTGLALLGATAPGIDTLRQLHDPVAASRITLRPGAHPQPLTGTRDRAVLIAAARRRRTHRKV